MSENYWYLKEDDTLAYYSSNINEIRETSHFIQDDDDNIFWYKYGFLHRDNDKPAVIGSTFVEWWVDGKRHRDNDKPAVIFKEDKQNGNNREYWFRGELHRENGPAVIRDRYCIEYFYYGKRHCLTGAALMIIGIKGDIIISRFYINGVEFNRIKFYRLKRLILKFINKLKEKRRRKFVNDLLLKTNMIEIICEKISLYYI